MQAWQCRMTSLPLPDPPLRDENTGVELRPWGRAGDAKALALAWCDPEVVANSRPPDDRSEDAARRWIGGEVERRRRGLALDLVVMENASLATAAGAAVSGAARDRRAVVGEVGLANLDDRGRAEIGFWLTPTARGRGLARVAVGLVTAWALDPSGLDRCTLWARVRPGAQRAGRVLQRAGYVRVGETSEYVIWGRDNLTL